MKKSITNLESIFILEEFILKASNALEERDIAAVIENIKLYESREGEIKGYAILKTFRYRIERIQKEFLSYLRTKDDTLIAPYHAENLPVLSASANLSRAQRRLPQESSYQDS